MIPQKALYVNAADGSFRVEEVKDEEIIGPLDFAYKYAYPKDKFFFGMGPLAGSIIPGSRRMIFCGKSPQWDNFYISTMGGAAQIFFHLNINYVVIEGACKEHSILKLKYEQGNLSASFEPVKVKKIWKGYNDKIGFYALQDYVYDQYHSEYANCLDEFGKFRILAVGPASLNTNMGAIGSAYVTPDGPGNVDCWAGRGGIGSKLLQKHKIAAIVYGGDYKSTELHNREEINKFFTDKYDEEMLKKDMEETIKYRYDPACQSGGTLGVNFTTTRKWLFSFNYSSIYLTDAMRLDIHNRLIVSHYLKQFNEETIAKKTFKTCGEACPVACKKMHGIYKKDYEPYQTLGPNAGIFDQRAAEKLNHYADAMGFDAIQIGGLVSWTMECLDKSLVQKEELGLSLMPSWDWKNFDAVNDSMSNAELGVQIIDMVLSPAFNSTFKDSIRSAAKKLDAKYKTNTQGLAVYNAYGENGCMVPNQYWALGLFSPMPIMGKYFQYYRNDIIDPYQLGKANVERMVKEFYSDNGGFCRFHRGWVEELLPEIINKHFGLNVDFYSHHKKLAQKINQDNKSVFWESERVVDIIREFFRATLADKPDNNDAKQWLARFEKDKWKAAKECWDEIVRGISDALKD
ncbi:aldehyde ferredoxin oxidoreductase [Candidatus Woesearchaeota archaeon]|nr:aldehyde ferredoxin oxidoreductase [Candidatus Woesearchaeota archaeon]